MEIKLTCNTEPIIVKQGEYGETLSIDCKEWIGDFGEGTITWLMQRPNGEDAYVLNSEEDGTITSVVLSAHETEIAGKGNIELSYTNNGDTYRTISRTLDLIILPSLFGSVPKQNLVYEEGAAVFEELTDGKFVIPFNNPHDVPPIYCIVLDENEYTENCMVTFMVAGYYSIDGSIPQVSGSALYGCYAKMRYVHDLNRMTGSIGTLKHLSDNDSTGLYYHVTKDAILASDDVGSGSHYIVGRTYKWFAVWNPAVKEIESEET